MRQHARYVSTDYPEECGLCVPVECQIHTHILLIKNQISACQTQALAASYLTTARIARQPAIQPTLRVRT